MGQAWLVLVVWYRALSLYLGIKLEQLTGLFVFIKGGAALGVLPSSSAIAWIPSMSAGASGATSAAAGSSLSSSSLPAVVQVPMTSSSATAPLGIGAAMGEGLLPVPAKLQQKIVRLEFIEMRELLPETWQKEEDDDGRRILWPKKPTGPITDILQWVQCYAALVGVLARAYPSMVPELMAYLGTIIKCARDFEGVSWAQYDRAYRRQAAQTKDLRWSRLNPTLYSLCFAGKAKKSVVCASCLSDSHETSNCPDNVFFPWQNVHTRTVQHQPPTVTATVGSLAKSRTGSDICYLFNAKDGPRCTYSSCRFAHRCALCKGPHARFFCRQKETGGVPAARGKRPRLD